MKFTALELVYFIAAFAILARGTIDGGITTQEAGLVMFLLGLVPVRRADKRKKDIDEEND